MVHHLPLIKNSDILFNPASHPGWDTTIRAHGISLMNNRVFYQQIRNICSAYTKHDDHIQEQKRLVGGRASRAQGCAEVKVKVDPALLHTVEQRRNDKAKWAEKESRCRHFQEIERVRLGLLKTTLGG